MVKALEENGVGRPSTYAPTITTIMARRYVVKEEKNLYVSELGEVVNQIMKENFPSIVDEHFTANMESLLDGVGEGNVNWKTVIANFYPDLDEAVKQALNGRIANAGQICCSSKRFIVHNSLKDAFAEKLKGIDDIDYVHSVIEHRWGQRVVRFYDPDRHIIEVGENIKAVPRRFLDSGMTEEDVSVRMDVPLEFVKSCKE